MAAAPGYFDRIRAHAEGRWLRWEADPETLAAIQLLFEQVKSPRHVISELLQNADDAGATEARIEITASGFSLAHNGKDFTEEQFRSLCSFGLSSKRNLHTVGFRGVGFKSTFSLGDEVVLQTPTLGVRFHADRFSLPEWNGRDSGNGLTEISVAFGNEHRREELLSNLRQWFANPMSILFFRSLSRLIANGEVIERTSEDSDYTGASLVSISGPKAREFLHIRTGNESFPRECVEEIRRIRRASDDTDFPPCAVDVVFPLKEEAHGDFFVVLPSGTSTNSSFSANAPFIQDVARDRILSPNESPTNRWLMERIGRAIFEFLEQNVRDEELAFELRTEVYDWIPCYEEPEDDLASQCRETVFAEVAGAAHEADELVLGDDGKTYPIGLSLGTPAPLADVWEADEAQHVLANSVSRPLIHREISEYGREVLRSWGWCEWLEDEEFLERISRCDMVPRPRNLVGYAHLWGWAISATRARPFWQRGPSLESIPLLPSARRPHLMQASLLVRLPRTWQNIPKALADFLAELVHAVDSDVLLGIEERSKPDDADALWKSATRFLQRVSMSNMTPMDRILGTACLFQQANGTHSNWIRLASIAALLNQRSPKLLKFRCRDGNWRGIEDILIAPSRQIPMEQLPPEWVQAHVLADDYEEVIDPTVRTKLVAWLRSDSSGIHVSVPVIPKVEDIFFRDELIEKTAGLGGELDRKFRYKRENYKWTDWDFPAEIVGHAASPSNEADEYWHALIKPFLTGATRIDVSRMKVAAEELGNQYSNDLTFAKPVVAAWIRRLRSLPCLRDADGLPAIPADLYSRNPATDPLRDFERFVLLEDDSEASRPILKALGVRFSPGSYQGLLDRIRDAASIQEPLKHLDGFARFYEGLNRALLQGNPDTLSEVAGFFGEIPAIPSREGEWCTLEEIHIHGDEDVIPNAPVVHPRLVSLPLWARIGVPERPSRDRIRAWLGQLPSNERLTDAGFRRLRRVLKQHPGFVLANTGHWLALDRGWRPVDSFGYVCSAPDGTGWRHLNRSHRAAVADLTMVSLQDLGDTPLVRLPELETCLEYDVDSCLPSDQPSQQPDWIPVLAEMIARVEQEEESGDRDLQSLAESLAVSRLVPVEELVVVPRLRGFPAGPPIDRKVAWIEDEIFVPPVPLARCLDDLCRVLTERFPTFVRDAIRTCVDRSGGFVREYFSSHFSLKEPLAFGSAEEPAEPPGEDGAEAGITVMDGHGERICTSEEGDVQIPKEVEVEESDSDEAEGTGSELHRPSHLTAREPTLIERFAAARGFRRETPSTFVHGNGERIERDGTGGFWSWRRINHAVHHLWVRNQDLHDGEFLLPHEVYGLSKSSGSEFHLLFRLGSDLGYITGEELQRWIHDRTVEVHPAEYRVRITGRMHRIREQALIEEDDD